MVSRKYTQMETVFSGKLLHLNKRKNPLQEVSIAAWLKEELLGALSGTTVWETSVTSVTRTIQWGLKTEAVRQIL